MAIIETEIWKQNPDSPGTVIFDSHRTAQDIFNELAAYMKSNGRLPDEYFLLDNDWQYGALFPQEAEILCNVNYGSSEGIGLDIAVKYKKDGELDGVNHSVIEHFATGKTLGDTVGDLDKMHLAASSVIEAFYGGNAEIKERYAEMGHGETIPAATAINGEIKCYDVVLSTGGGEYPLLIGEVNAVHKLGSPEHDGGSKTDDVFVDFRSEEYSESRIKEIEEHFTRLYGEPKRFEDLTFELQNVKMRPGNLIRLKESEMEPLLESCEKAASFCSIFAHRQCGDPKFDELAERIEKNLSDYYNHLSGFDQSTLISMVDRIKAMSDAHSYLTVYHDFEDDELDFFLQFENPLEVVADDWQERNMDLSDMSFTMEHIESHRESLLEDYPLIADANAPELPETIANQTIIPEQSEQSVAQPNLSRFMDVDVIDFLGKISERVMPDDPDCWSRAKNALSKAAAQDDFEDKRIIWQIGSAISRLRNESEVFVKGSRAKEYEAEPISGDTDILVYAMEFTRREGDAVIGNVFEGGSFPEHAKRVRDTALTLDSVTLKYDDAWGIYKGKKITVSPDSFEENYSRFMETGGKVVSLHFNPKDEAALSEILDKERSARMTYPIESTEAHLDKLKDKFNLSGDLPDETEKTAEKPKTKTLEEKLNAAKEKSKAHGAQNNTNTKTRKAGERG